MAAKRVKQANDNKKPRKLLLNLTDEDGRRLDELVARMPFASHTGLATHAMRIGLMHIEEDPTILVAPSPRPPMQKTK